MTLRIFYHRDFDGMASAAILARALHDSGRESEITWDGVNFDKALDWPTFDPGLRFAVVDFHFHAAAEYWFDHHPTTFLDPQQESEFRNDSRRNFDPQAPSCPPILLAHAKEHWGWDADANLQELAHWSNIIDAATFATAEQALFGREPALRLMRALTCAPDYSFHNRIVGMMRTDSLVSMVSDLEVLRCADRAERNRDNALENFPPNVLDRTPLAIFADLRSKRIRRERFAPYYLYPELQYSVILMPTRAGVHITVSANPWNRPEGGPHLGHLMKQYGGGGHLYVGGCNPPDSDTASVWAREIFDTVSAPTSSSEPRP